MFCSTLVACQTIFFGTYGAPCRLATLVGCCKALGVVCAFVVHIDLFMYVYCVM